MLDMSKLLSERKGLANIASLRTASSQSNNDPKALADQAHKLKRSFLDQKTEFYNSEISEIDQNLQTLNQQQCNKDQTRINALQAERKAAEAELSAAAKEVEKLNGLVVNGDKRSSFALDADIKKTELELRDLEKLKKADSIEDADNQLAVENSKPAQGAWVYKPGLGWRGAGGTNTWQPGRNHELVKSLEQRKTVDEAGLKDLVAETTSEQKLLAAKTGFVTSTDKSRKSADKLILDLQGLATRSLQLSVVELSKLQNTLGESMQGLKSVMGASQLKQLKAAMSSLNPAMRNQLNETLGLDEIFKSIDESSSLKFKMVTKK